MRSWNDWLACINWVVQNNYSMQSLRYKFAYLLPFIISTFISDPEHISKSSPVCNWHSGHLLLAVGGQDNEARENCDPWAVISFWSIPTGCTLFFDSTHLSVGLCWERQNYHSLSLLHNCKWLCEDHPSIPLQISASQFLSSPPMVLHAHIQ